MSSTEQRWVGGVLNAVNKCLPASRSTDHFSLLNICQSRAKEALKISTGRNTVRSSSGSIFSQREMPPPRRGQ